MGGRPTQQARNDGAPPPPERAPLILTLELAPPVQTLFQALRDRHFPPERNLVPAHVSLFHALPGAERDGIVRRLCRVDASRFAVTVAEPFGLGRGVAFRLRSPALEALRARLAADWAPWLTPQDRAGFRAHVTVQNKVDPAEAGRTLAQLSRGFVPFETEAVALRLWRYLGGPWEALHRQELPEAAPDGPVARGTATRGP